MNLRKEGRSSEKREKARKDERNEKREARGEERGNVNRKKASEDARQPLMQYFSLEVEVLTRPLPGASLKRGRGRHSQISPSEPRIFFFPFFPFFYNSLYMYF